MCDESFSTSSQGHRYGNFHQYYSFHPAEDRLSLLPPGFFVQLWREAGSKSEFSLLDIGCNDGTLTFKLFQRAQAELPEHVHVLALGVDLDEELINKATNTFVTPANVNNVKFVAYNIMGVADGYQTMENKSLSDESTSLSSSNLSQQNDNVQSILTRTFDLVCLFSITMWVHLNHGDEGFTRLIRTVATLSHSSILIEPQRWKSYRTAAKRCRKFGMSPFPYSNADLNLKDVDKAIRDILFSSPCGFKEGSALGMDGWERPLLLFRRQIDSGPPSDPTSRDDCGHIGDTNPSCGKRDGTLLNEDTSDTREGKKSKDC